MSLIGFGAIATRYNSPVDLDTLLVKCAISLCGHRAALLTSILFVEEQRHVAPLVSCDVPSHVGVALHLLDRCPARSVCIADTVLAYLVDSESVVFPLRQINSAIVGPKKG